MLCCEDALVLTDSLGRVCHANYAWASLTGYSVSEIEGFTCSFLQGPRTNAEDCFKCQQQLLAGQPAEMVVVNYRKDRSEFINHVMMVPLKAGYKTDAITHYCALCVGCVV